MCQGFTFLLNVYIFAEKGADVCIVAAVCYEFVASFVCVYTPGYSATDLTLLQRCLQWDSLGTRLYEAMNLSTVYCVPDFYAMHFVFTCRAA